MSTVLANKICLNETEIKHVCMACKAIVKKYGFHFV